MRKSIVGKSGVKVVPSYFLKDLKRLPNRIRKGGYNACYFPMDLLREKSRVVNACADVFEACVETLTPVYIETRRKLPSWLVEVLTRHKESTVALQLMTMDYEKMSRYYPDASTPEEIFQSFVDCFNRGANTVLKINPIIPSVISLYDVYMVIDYLRNVVGKVEIGFAVLDEHEYKFLSSRTRRKFPDAMSYFEKVEDLYYVRSDYREEFIRRVETYVSGLKLDIEVQTEVKIMDNKIVGRIDTKGEN